jgi:quercetin dioxygenase-like cupin family protein
MREEVLFERGSTLVRRLRMEPGEAMRWHVDPFHRVTVVLQGDALELQYRDDAEKVQVIVVPGQVGWDEPTARPHRAVNAGGVYEEVTVFFRDREGVPHQPDA